MLAQTAQQALRASRRPLTAPRAIALARQASSAGPSRAAATAPKKSSSKSASASSSASAGPSSSNTSEPVVKPRPEELPRTGFFAQRTKPGPPTTKAKNADLVVPPLARPPGVPNPPTTAAKTWSERKEQYLDADRHQAKRKALVKEATQGYFHDYNRARSASGGKLWTAPPVLIREDRAMYFPDISGKSLKGEVTHTTDLLKGKVSLLSIVSARISEEHVHSFTAPLLPDWPNSPIFQHVQINHQANSLKSMLLSLFLSGLKRSVAEKDWGRYIVSGGAWSHFDVDGPLGIENQLLGYVFLIDDNAKIRWAGCGPATDKEAQDLRTATAVLMRRVMEKADAAAESSESSAR